MFLKHFNRILATQDDNSTFNLILQIVSIVVFIAMTMGFGLMPYFIEKCRKSTKFLSLSNAFSGGLFLGIGLFHCLPEGAEMLENFSKAPIAFFCAFLSYALILFVEKVAFNSHSLLHGHGHDHTKGEEHNVKITVNSEANKELKDEENDKKEPLNTNELKEIQSDENNKSNIEQVDEHEHENEHEHEHDHEHEHEHEHDHKNKGSSITPYILLIALGFHGLFEGMALGIQKDFKSTISLMLAIIAHKWAASLTLGISFVKSGIEKRQLIIMMIIFSLIGPIGVFIGIILSKEANDTVQGIFLSITVGTFIYIACTEVLVEEFESPNYKYLKFLMFMLGGIFIGGLSIVEIILDIDE